MCQRSGKMDKSAGICGTGISLKNAQEIRETLMHPGRRRDTLENEKGVDCPYGEIVFNRL